MYNEEVANNVGNLGYSIKIGQLQLQSVSCTQSCLFLHEKGLVDIANTFRFVSGGVSNVRIHWLHVRGLIIKLGYFNGRINSYAHFYITNYMNMSE